ncbi:MAG TPA: hypothetical protein PK453_05795 [Leptospiraceae bacterium]|nr:hypothetical protein [Leptospiraceae bacterium]
MKYNDPTWYSAAENAIDDERQLFAAGSSVHNAATGVYGHSGITGSLPKAKCKKYIAAIYLRPLSALYESTDMKNLFSFTLIFLFFCMSCNRWHKQSSESKCKKRASQMRPAFAYKCAENINKAKTQEEKDNEVLACIRFVKADSILCE